MRVIKGRILEYQNVGSVNLMQKRKIDEAKVNLKIQMQYLGKISQFFVFIQSSGPEI